MLAYFLQFFSKYFKSLKEVKFPIIASEKSLQYQTTTSFFTTRLQPSNTTTIKKRFEINSKQIFSSGKMRTSGNCIYDYNHSFFGEDF